MAGYQRPATQDGSVARVTPIEQQYTENLFSRELVDWQFPALSIPVAKVDGALGTTLLIKTVSTPYTILATDIGYWIRFDTAGTVTLPDGIAAGWQGIVSNVSSGVVTFSAATTLNAQVNTISVQYAAASLINIGSDVWELYGDLS